MKKFTTFKDVQMILKQFFDISTGFRFSKMQWVSVPSILVAVLGLITVVQKSIIGDETKQRTKKKLHNSKYVAEIEKQWITFC